MSVLSDLELPEVPDPAVLAAWDEAGFPAGPGEDFAAYRARLREKADAVEALEKELSEHGETTVFGSLKVSEKDRIPSGILHEAAEITFPLYGFAFSRFPGFFLSENVGLLWGGCLITDTESPLGVFFIRESFRTRKRFFIYRRQELLAHELCHAARHELADWAMDEFFAYQTSPSRLRRYLGNCFIRQSDAIFFALPAIVLLAAQTAQSFLLPRLPIWPFWIAALGYPCLLFLRNHLGRRRLFRAEKNLKRFGMRNARAILFRATGEERKELAELKDQAGFAEFLKRHGEELRWRVTLFRFGGTAADNPEKMLSKGC